VSNDNISSINKDTVNNVSNNVSSYINMSEQTIEKTLDAVKDNFIRSIDEYVKIQPRFLQSVSDFQLDYIQSTKDIINKTVSQQKGLLKEFVNLAQSQPNETYRQLFQKSNENIDNFMQAFTAGNKFNFDAMDNFRDNMRVYNKSLDAYSEYATNTFNAWTSFTKSLYNRK
jgi:paraquat-inducible protein B